MKKVLLTLMIFAISALNAIAFPTKESKAVRDIITKVNDHWQSTNPAETRAFWDNAAYHTGNMEAYFLIGDEDWRDYSEKWAEHNLWMGAKGKDRSKWRYNNTASRTTMCSSATGRYASRFMPTFTKYCPTTAASNAPAR